MISNSLKSVNKLVFLTGFALTSTHTMAQSRVQLYGVLDAGINYVSNARLNDTPGSPGAAQYSLTSGPMQGSRWGLKGSEDLGGGLRAVFQVENGFTVNNGAIAQGGAEFGRQAFVGLAGPSGSVLLGRQYDFVAAFVGPLSANRYAGYFASHPNDFDNLNQTFRVNNSVKYVSPEWHGFTVGAMYGFGGVAGSMSRNQVLSLGIRYVNGPVKAAIAYVNARDPNTGLYGNTPAGGGAAANNIGANSPVFSGYASASTLQIVAAGISYSMRSTTLHALYTNTQFRGLGNLSAGPNPYGYGGNATFHNAELGATYSPVQPWLFGLSYNMTYATGASNKGSATYHQFNGVADYLLSKRTDVYALLGYQLANGHGSTGTSAVAAFTNTTPSASGRQVVVRLGMRHTF